MKKNKKIIVYMILIFILFIFRTNTYAQEEYSEIEGYITISVEKFSLGQGYFIEPTKVPFYKDDKGSDLITRILGEGNYKNTGSIEDSFYLARIKDTSNENIIFPEHIVEATAGNLDTTRGDEWLGEFDYYYMSGWMYSVNGIFPNYGFSAYKPKDGDVMRVQFTVSGYGADIGANNLEWGVPDYIKIGNREKLTKIISEINDIKNLEEVLEYDNFKKNYEKAYEIIINLESSQDEIDYICSELVKIKNYKNNNVKDKNVKNKISRESVAEIIYNYIGIDNFDKNRQIDLNIIDIDEDRPSKKAIEALYKLEILDGYENKNFYPEKYMTRAEFAKILCKLKKLEKVETSKFKDINSHWARLYINSVVANGLMEGFEGNIFKPDDSITNLDLERIIDNK